MLKPQSFVLSDGSMTTKRIVVPTSSINLTAFQANPVMLFNHKRGEVYGKWDNVRVENGKLLGDPVFDDALPEVAKIAGQVDRGFIKAASIGIRNVVAEELSDQDGAYYNVVSCDLREASITDIPSNPNALVLFDDNDEEVNLSDVNFSDLFQTKKTVTNKMDKKKIASILKLSDDVSDSALEGAIEVAFKDSEELKALKTSLAQKQKAKAVELCDAAIAEGRLDKEAKAGFLELADVNFESFEKTLAKLTKPVTLTDFAKGGAAAGGAVEATRKDWTFTDWSKKDSAGLAKMDEASRKALYAAEFGDE